VAVSLRDVADVTDVERLLAVPPAESWAAAKRPAAPAMPAMPARKSRRPDPLAIFGRPLVGTASDSCGEAFMG